MELADHRPHRPAEDGQGIGRHRSAVRHGAGRERELPDADIGDAGFERSSGHAELAAVPAGKLDERCPANG